MTARHLTKKLCRKDEIHPGPAWCIAEKLPSLCMDRILQDSEYVYQTVCDWSRNIDNHFVFLKRNHRYRLFREPHSYLSTDPTSSTIEPQTTPAPASFTEESKKALLEEFFGKEATQVPNMEGILWLREGRKKWIKHLFVLRPSGIYYTPKGKRKSRDIALLASFEHYNVYTCQGYKTNFKAPHDHVFAIKHPQVQTTKSKHAFVLCASTREERNRWMTFIRMAKYGYAMYEDYLATKEEELAIASGRARKKDTVEKGVSEQVDQNVFVDRVQLNSESVLSSVQISSTCPSPNSSRHEFNQVLSATFPRSRDSSPKTARSKYDSSTLPKDLSAYYPRTLLTSTTSAPPDLVPPPPPPLGSIPQAVPHGVKRKETRIRKKKGSESGGSGGSTSSSEPRDDPL